MNVKQKKNVRVNLRRRGISQRWDAGNKRIELQKWNRCAIKKSVFIPRRARRGC